MRPEFFFQYTRIYTYIYVHTHMHTYVDSITISLNSSASSNRMVDIANKDLRIMQINHPIIVDEKLFEYLSKESTKNFHKIIGLFIK